MEPITVSIVPGIALRYTAAAFDLCIMDVHKAGHNKAQQGNWIALTRVRQMPIVSHRLPGHLSATHPHNTLAE